MITEKRVLYLGLDPANYRTTGILTHFPLIKIVPFELVKVQSTLKQFSQFTHILITSKSTIPILLNYLADLNFKITEWKDKQILAVGQGTARALEEVGLVPHQIAKDETSEGIIDLLKELNLKTSHVFWPHSALSRPIIRDFLKQQSINLTECLLYDTLPCFPSLLPLLENFDEIVFTSPSTVDAFLKNFGPLPKFKILTSIGPITEKYLQSKLELSL